MNLEGDLIGHDDDVDLAVILPGVTKAEVAAHRLATRGPIVEQGIVQGTGPAAKVVTSSTKNSSV